MTQRSSRDVLDFAEDAEDHLLDNPVRLRDIRSIMARVEAFAEGVILKRSILGQIATTVGRYYPLPEFIQQFRRRQAVYHEHVRLGDFDDRYDHHVLISGTYGVCWRWMDRRYRYPYGDVRLLRPIIEEVLDAAREWDEIPHPEDFARLERWYQELAPGGALYPSEAHLEYVRRFEAFAEDIIWDSRGREYLTIVNFPAPANALPPTEWWCTQHVLEDD